MDKKALAVSVVVIVAAACLASYLYMGDDPGDGTDVSIGDFVTYGYDYSYDGESWQHECDITRTVTATDGVDGFPYQVLEESEFGTKVTWEQSFAAIPGSALAGSGYAITGSGTMETSFGAFAYDVWEHGYDMGRSSFHDVYWLAQGDGMVLYEEHGSMLDGYGLYSRYTLTDTSLVGDTPLREVTTVPESPEYGMSGEPAVLTSSDDASAGDYVIQAVDTYVDGVGHREYRIMEIREVLDEGHMVTWSTYGEPDSEYTGVTDRFLPVFAGAVAEGMELIGTETIDTPFGEVECGVWQRTESQGGLVDTVTCWVSVDGDVVLRSEENLLDGGWAHRQVVTLLGSSLVTSSVGGHPAVP